MPQNAPRDGNWVPTALFEISGSNRQVMPGQINQSTGRILVDMGGGGSGTVTEVDTGTGLTGGPITTTGTISLDSKLAPIDTLGTAGQSIRVNAGATALEYYTPSSGTGTVTSVSVATANGVSGTVANPTTTPAITLTLGAITPSSVNISGLTASEIVATDGSENLVSLATATYPSLTELSYVKGVTSAIQTQLNAKGAGTVTAVSSANTAFATVANGTTTPAITIVAAPAITSATTTVNTSSATAPSSGQVLTATSSTAATWQTPTTGTVTAVSVASANGFAGSSSGGATPALTISTSINSPVLAGNGTAISGATTTGTGSTVVLATGPTMTNPVVGTQTTTDNSTKAASTAYVTTAIANAVAGVNPAVAVQAATTAAGDTSGFTYNNGVSGIGATFTGTTNTAVTIDGFTFTALGQRLLIKNDTQSPSGAFNGVYYVTQVQTSLLPPILTRALDYDTPSDMNNTGAIPVVNGTANANTSWLLTSTVATVGTDPLTYVQFSLAPSSIVTLTGTQTLTNKRITRRLTTVNAPGATPSTNTDNLDIANFTGLATAITSMTTNLSGTPTDGQLVEFRFTDNATARAITWGASFGSTTVTLPTTTVISTMLRVLVEWNATASLWQCIAVA